jgi:serine/threonine-protein kinase RsbT
MTTQDAGRMPLRNEHDIMMARQAVRQIAQRLKFSLVDQTKLVTAASELARNAMVYGGGGDMDWEVVRNGSRSGLKLAFVDQGPGISDLSLALTDGWTSGGGLGLGLSGARRLVNDFELHSEAGAGTRVVITRWQ